MSEQNVEPSSAELLQNAFSDEPITESPVANVTELVETTSGHPAYQEILNNIPEMFRDKVLPTLQAWDTGVNKKLEDVRGEYADLAAFKEQGITAEQLATANQLYQALEQDPAAFYKQLGEHYKFATEPSAVEPELDLGEYAPDVDLAQHPLFKQQQEQLAQMQAQFESVEAERSQKEADIWLETRQAQISAQLEEKNIDVDWDYILPRAAAEAQRTNDYDKALDNATKAFEAMVVKYRTPVANSLAPPVMTPSGAVPASPNNINALADGDRRKLVAQMLTQAFKD